MSAVNPFKKATKKQTRLRLGLIGPPGSGKTYTSLAVTKAMAAILSAEKGEEAKVALVDTEFHSSEKYADIFDFDVSTLDGSFHPKRYVEQIRAAESAGYDFLIIDSLSHAWIGKDGGLDLHDKAVERQRGHKNPFTAWKEVTPHHMELVQALVQCRCHLIVTVRSKVEYVQSKDANGKTTVQKVGMAPLMREGIEYEFDVTGDLDVENTLVISKTRCVALKRAVIKEPGESMARTLMEWLGSGAPAEPVVINGASERIVTGPALLQRITAKDAHLAAEGLCQVGDLLTFIRNVGDIKGLGRKIEEWPEEGFHLAAAEVRAFEQQRRSIPRRPRDPGDDPPGDD